uniref:ABC transporter ATP-binding protein n=1 Tax=Devosia sp. TaxID=1871048 RepID=UPI002AFFA20D
KPKLLIADEPTTALDVTIQAQVLELIKELQADEGMSVLFITHDMGVVAEMADRTVVMYHGNVVEQGPTAQIFRIPQQAYTRRLLNAVPRIGSMAGEIQPQRFNLGDETDPHPAPVAADRSDRGPAAETPLLSVRDLVVRFNVRSGLLRRVGGRVHAVEKVSLDLRAGETLSLVGESGCGKSTLGRTIMRLTEPQSGSVLLDGEDIARMNGALLHKRRGDIQMVFQDPFASLNPRRKIGDTIAEPLLTHRLASRAGARAKALDLLEKVGLSRDMADRLPHEFSGGQRQRICIARALALNPKLLVADEAVSALDVSIKAQVINLMLDLQQELGLAYLFISHDMAVVERFSHRVAVMYLGEIVEIGARAAIFGNPQHPYTRRLLSTVPVPDPGQRNLRRKMANFELRSPIRSLDFQPSERRYRVVGDDHLVHDWTDDWEK